MLRSEVNDFELNLIYIISMLHLKQYDAIFTKNDEFFQV